LLRLQLYLLGLLLLQSFVEANQLVAHFLSASFWVLNARISKVLKVPLNVNLRLVETLAIFLEVAGNVNLVLLALLLLHLLIRFLLVFK